MKRKTTEEFIADARKVHGDKYDYSKVEYVNKRTKVIITCPIHGDFLQLPSNHINGHGCPECGKMILEKRNNRNKLTLNYFIEKAQKVHDNKYDYSKVKYINNKTKVCIICPEHGEFEQIPNNHLRGIGCPQCGLETNTRHRTKKTLDFITEAKELHGDKYNYTKTEYQSAHTNVIIICPEHGEFKQTPHNHLKGQNCPKCAGTYMDSEYFIEKSTKIHNNKYNYSKINYIDTNTKVCIVCPEHGEFWQRPYDHLSGHGCPKCIHQQSKPELEIIEFLKQYLKPKQIIERNREILDGREIDILLPDFHVGIEFNGLHWHNTKHKPDINYHRDKMRLANSKGYRLIQIFEDEWTEHRETVLNKLRHVINGDADNPTIGARKTVIRQINREMAKVFLEQYHIQGYVGSSVYLGAFYNDKLVGVMTFTEEQSKMWNLTRFTTKTDYKLPGLANKMFKYFLKNYEYIEIKSFLDLRWNQPLGDSTVYNKLGFELVKMTNPDYRYVVGNERLHKFGFRKDKLHRKYGLPLSMTEREMCNELGFERIYDCGLAKYVYKNPQAEN